MVRKLRFSAAHFMPMLESQAKAIAGWTYAPPYALYSLSAESERDELIASLIDPNNHYYACFDEDNQVLAYYCFGEEARVRGGDYGVDALDIGGGIRPDVTGHGHGKEFLQSGIILARKLFAPTYLRMTIAGFNVRAQRVAQGLGFEETERFVRASDQREFVVLVRACKTDPM